MKLSCNQDNLSKGLNIVGKIIGNRGNLPVLNNILLSTDKGRLKLSSTDLEIGINTWIGAKIEQDGAITVPAKLLIEFVQNNTDEKINIETKGNTLNIKSKKYKANIKGINASEFPLIPGIDKNILTEFDAKYFQEAINKTIFAAAFDETRPILAGVFMSLSDDFLKVVATDSYRLAEATLKNSQANKKKIKIIVPSRTMSEISRIVAIVNPNKLKIYLSDNQISFSFADTQIVSRLIEGNYPDYQQIIPKTSTTKVKISVKEFANALKMASFFARESANNIKLAITKDKKAQISAISPQVGDSVSEIMVESFEGENIEIAFNSKFVLDTISAVNEQYIFIEANGNSKPAVIKPFKEKQYLYIIMPLRVED